jgi:type IV secretory pathway TraG/TraD family ATPase VirD4
MATGNASALSNVWGTLTQTLGDSNGWLLMGLLVVLLGVKFISPQKKGLLTTAEWANVTAKINAVRLAQKQLKSSKINDVCLWVGSAPKWKLKGICPILLTAIGQMPTVYVPQANRSVAVVGKPNSGKTFSALNPMIASALEQGMSVVLYEYKADAEGLGGQMAYLATLAVRHGYKLNVFAPGKPYTCVINPLDFMENEEDDTTAAVLAEVFHANLTGGGRKGDEFFGSAGKRLIQALFQFAKSTKYPDLAMAFNVLALPRLVERLDYAANDGRLPYFVRVSFSQFISTLGADKTTSGIQATASDLLTRFISPVMLPSLMGKTNTSLLLGEKEMIVFQSDIFRQSVVNPLLAAIINIVMNKNFSIARTSPIVFSADELPSIYLPKLPTWANEHRSKGYTGLYGYQSAAQLREGYGKEGADILLGGLASSFWFLPANHDEARSYQEELGNIEVKIRNKSWSPGRGGGTSYSEQLQTRPLMLADEFNSFDVGECVYRNPAYKKGKKKQQKSRLPLHFSQLTIPKVDIAREKECEAIWKNKLCKNLTDRETARRPSLNVVEQLEARLREAETLLPLPPDDDDDF